MKQQQSGLITGIVTSLVAWAITIGVLVVTESFKKIVWPLACFIAKLAWKGLRHIVSKLLSKKSPVAKSSKPSPQLPTPDIFKNAPNLAPAKDVRF
jgi:hypothetical protein